MTRGIDLTHVTMTYRELLTHFEPRPIESDEHYWAAQEIIDALLAKPTLSVDEQTYLHLLSMLIEAYDEQQETIPEFLLRPNPDAQSPQRSRKPRPWVFCQDGRGRFPPRSLRV